MMATNTSPEPLPRTKTGHLTREARLAVYACKGLYAQVDVATYYGLNRTTVCDIWRMKVTEADMVPAPPNIEGTRITSDLILADTQILLDRGLTLDEVADLLDTTPSTIRKVFMREGRRFHIRHGKGRAA